MDVWTLLIGEAVHDVTESADGVRREQPGGSAANQAVGLARLGHRVLLASCWAHDAPGLALAAHLADSGVGLACDPLTLERTPSALVRLAADGHPSYELDVAWRLGPLTLPSTPPTVVGTGSFAAVLDEATVLAQLKRWRGQALRYYDVNARPAVTGVGPDVLARTRALLAEADLVKVSEEDLELLWPGEDHEALLQDWLDQGVAAVLLSRGSRGATWVSRTVRVHVPAQPVQVVAAVGAGDSLASAVVHGLLVRGATSSRALRELDEAAARDVVSLAVRAAGITVSRPGADPPRLHEL